MRFYTLLFILCLFILSATKIVAQTVDTTETVTQMTGDDDFVDLSDQATVIKVEAEKPRVTLITERIKPQFTDINLDKSFKNEILSKSDKTLLKEKIAPADRLIIDVEKILNKSR